MGPRSRPILWLLGSAVIVYLLVPVLQIWLADWLKDHLPLLLDFLKWPWAPLVVVVVLWLLIAAIYRWPHLIRRPSASTPTATVHDQAVIAGAPGPKVAEQVIITGGEQTFHIGVAKADEKPKPDFHGEIETTFTDYLPEHPSDTAAHVLMTITNDGAPSPADRWEAYATIAGARRTVPLVMLAENTTLVMNDGKEYHLTAADALYNKAMKGRIETGAVLRGWLRLHIEGVKSDDFLVPGNSIEVPFEDYLGKVYTTTHIFSVEGKGPLKYQPGSGLKPGPGPQ